MARQKITLNNFDGGMSDDPRIQTTRQVFDNDGFDILNENHMLKPLKDWSFRCDYEAESLIDWSVSENVKPIYVGGQDFIVMTEDGSGNARPIKVDNVHSGTVSYSDPVASVTGTPRGLKPGAEIKFLDRVWFVDSSDDLGYYDLSDDSLNYGVYNGSDYDFKPPIISPDKKSLLFPYQNQINEVSYNPSTGAYTYNAGVLVLPDVITSIAKKDTLVMVASYDEDKGSKVSPWNVLEEDVIDTYLVSEDEIYAMGQLNNAFMAVTGSPDNAGDFTASEPYIEFFFLRSSGFEKYRRFDETVNGSDLRYNKVTFFGNKMYVVGRQSLWVIGSRNSDYPMVVSRLATLKLDSSKYSGIFDEASMYTIFSNDRTLGVVGEIGTSSEDKRGLFLLDSDPDNYIKASMTTQKYRFGNVGQSSQLVDTEVSFDTTSPVNSASAMFVRVDDTNFTSAIDNQDCSTQRVSRSKRLVNGVNFPIGNEWFFKVTSRDGAIINEISFDLAPRKTRHNNG